MFESRVVRSWIFDDREKVCYGCDCLARRADLRIVRRATAHTVLRKGSYLVDPASSHMLVSKIKPCMSKYKRSYTAKLRMAH